MRSVHNFSGNAKLFSESLHEVALAQFNIAESVVNLYAEKASMREVARFRAAHGKIISSFWNEYVSYTSIHYIFCFWNYLLHRMGDWKVE